MTQVLVRAGTVGPNDPQIEDGAIVLLLELQSWLPGTLNRINPGDYVAVKLQMRLNSVHPVSSRLVDPADSDVAQAKKNGYQPI